MGWFDDVANAVGFSSKSLGVNTAEDKAAREAAAAQQAEAERIKALEAEQAKQAINANVLGEIQRRTGVQIAPQPVDLMGPPKPAAPQEESIWDKIRHGATSGRQFLTDTDLGKTILGAGAQIGGGLLANQMAKGDYKAAEDTLRQAAEQAGTYEEVGPSQTSLIQDSPEMLALRQQSLKGLQERASMGLTPEDQAMLNQIRNQTNAQHQSRQAAIQEDMARKGMGNSGLNLASQMLGNQQATQTASEQADQQAAMAFKAKQAALQNLGTAASGAIQSDFSRDLARTSAADKFNLENVQNKMAAARQKAGYMAPIAQSQAQKGARTSGLISNIGQGIGSAIQGAIQKKKQ